MKQGKIVLGTFHKTGTVLIQSILRTAAKQLGFRLWMMHVDPEPPEWDVGFHSHSRFTGEVLEKVYRGAVVIRDPRDVIISAAHYHAKSEEKWLHRKRPEFGGLTYQQAINKEPEGDGRLIFEMKHSAANTITQMLKLREDQPDFRLVKFEALVSDYELTEFEALFRWLGFDEEAMPTLLKIAKRRSIFGGKLKNEGGHIRSGAAQQWRKEFSPHMLQAYSERWGTAAEKLGYAPSDVSLLEPEPAEA